MWVFVGQAEHANATLDAARVEQEIVASDVGDADLALDQCRIDAQRAR